MQSHLHQRSYAYESTMLTSWPPSQIQWISIYIMLSNRIKRRIDDFTSEVLHAAFEHIQGIAAVVWQALVDGHPGADAQALRSDGSAW